MRYTILLLLTLLANLTFASAFSGTFASIPAVSRAPGAHGTFWVTDLYLYNNMDVPIDVLLKYYPVSGNHLEYQIELAPKEQMVFQDFLLTFFGLEETYGALFIDASAFVNPDLDEAAAFIAHAHVYNNAQEGTYGMKMPDVNWDVALLDKVSYLIGLMNNDIYRTNIGINTDISDEGRIAITVKSCDGEVLETKNVEIEGNFQLIQFPLQANTDCAFAEIQADERVEYYYPYAIIIDNRTGDPYLVSGTSPINVYDKHLQSNAKSNNLFRRNADLIKFLKTKKIK